MRLHACPRRAWERIFVASARVRGYYCDFRSRARGGSDRPARFAVRVQRHAFFQCDLLLTERTLTDTPGSLTRAMKSLPRWLRLAARGWTRAAPALARGCCGAAPRCAHDGMRFPMWSYAKSNAARVPICMLSYAYIQMSTCVSISAFFCMSECRRQRRRRWTRRACVRVARGTGAHRACASTHWPCSRVRAGMRICISRVDRPLTYAFPHARRHG